MPVVDGRRPVRKLDRDGAQIGFIGATTANTANIVYPPFVAGIHFAPVAASVNAVVPELEYILGDSAPMLLIHDVDFADRMRHPLAEDPANGMWLSDTEPPHNLQLAGRR